MYRINLDIHSPVYCCRKSTSTWNGLFWQLITLAQNTWKLAALVNFLIFLASGKYQFLIERLLHIRPVFPRPQGVRQVIMDNSVLFSACFTWMHLEMCCYKRSILEFLSRVGSPASHETSTFFCIILQFV